MKSRRIAYRHARRIITSRKFIPHPRKRRQFKHKAAIAYLGTLDGCLLILKISLRLLKREILKPLRKLWQRS